MVEEQVLYSIKKDIIGKIVVGKTSGKKIGLVSDVEFDPKTGQLLYLILTDVTPFAIQLGIQKEGKVYKISATAIDSIGDFIIVDESSAAI